MSEQISEVSPDLFVGTELDSVDVVPEDIMARDIDPVLVAVASFNTSVWLVREAQLIANDAESWRGYQVGAAMLAHNFQTGLRGILLGANIKPGPDDDINIHAEQMALAKVRHLGLNEVFAVAVWGDPDDKDANPSGAPTRRPCQRCDQMFVDVPEVSDRTLIVSSNADLSVNELYTAGELHDYLVNERSGPINDIPTFDLSDATCNPQYVDELEVTQIMPKIMRLYPKSRITQAIFGKV